MDLYYITMIDRREICKKKTTESLCRSPIEKLLSPYWSSIIIPPSTENRGDDNSPRLMPFRWLVGWLNERANRKLSSSSSSSHLTRAVPFRCHQWMRLWRVENVTQLRGCWWPTTTAITHHRQTRQRGTLFHWIIHYTFELVRYLLALCWFSVLEAFWIETKRRDETRRGC